MLGSANGYAHAEALSEVRKADAAEREVLEAPSELPSVQVSHCLSKLGPGDTALDSQTSKLTNAQSSTFCQGYEVTAATLCEAVAQGLAAMRGNEWVAGIAQGFNVVKVSVADIRVEREVKLRDFTSWLEKAGGSSSREVRERHKIRSILGMPVSR